ncbi:MAG: hypothetical protein ABSG05_02100 [Candidatus Pacearchaeota archaeon]
MVFTRTQQEGLSKVSSAFRPDEIIEDITILLDEAISKRTPEFPEPMIREDYKHFTHMKNIGMVDGRGPRLLPSSIEEDDCCLVNYHFLSKDAIKFHRDHHLEEYTKYGKF